MKDERRPCANCGHDHAYGILRYSPDGVPLYGARKCWCHCSHFVRRNEEAERKFISHDGAQLPANLDDKETKELWADTAFLSSQVPMATRIAVRQITNLLKSNDVNALLTKAFPEFAGLMISQITDIRGAMTRDESKFNHLVSHTDEVVESMRGVVQLNERLTNIVRIMSEFAERQQKMESDLAGIAAVLKKLVPEEVEIRQADADYPVIDDPDERPVLAITNGKIE